MVDIVVMIANGDHAVLSHAATEDTSLKWLQPGVWVNLLGQLRQSGKFGKGFVGRLPQAEDWLDRWWL